MDRLSLLDTEYCFNLAIDSQGLGVISGSFNIPVGQRAVVAVSKDIVSVSPPGTYPFGCRILLLLSQRKWIRRKF